MMIIAKELANRYSPKPIIAEMPPTVEQHLQKATVEIQGWLENNRGEHYTLADIGDVLRDWLEQQIEQLAEEAVYHCVSGSRSFAVGRGAFQKLLDKKPCGASPEDIDKLYQNEPAPESPVMPEPEAA